MFITKLQIKKFTKTTGKVVFHKKLYENYLTLETSELKYSGTFKPVQLPP